MQQDDAVFVLLLLGASNRNNLGDLLLLEHSSVVGPTCSI